VMAPVPTCVDAEHPAKYPPFTYLDFMTEYSGANYSRPEQAAAGVALSSAAQ